MSSPGKVENFEIAELTDFTKGQAFKTSRYASHSFTLIDQGKGATPSGIRAAHFISVGQKELVVGDDSILRIEFGEKVTNLSWQYYVVTDFTEQDLQEEYPDQVGKIDLAKLTHEDFSTFLTIKTFNDGVEHTYDGGNPGVLSTATLKEVELDAMEVQTSRAGTVHFDMFRWTVAPSKHETQG